MAVSNALGAALSVPATLDVFSAPSIFVQPGSLFAPLHSNPSFTVTAFGEAPLSYHWTFNGAPLPGATGPTLTLPNVQAASAGLYQVTVSNASAASPASPAN